MASPNANDFFENSLPEFRPDLVMRDASFRGFTSYIVKDPVSLTYTRIGRQEHLMAKLLDGKRGPQEVLQAMNRAFPDQRWEIPRLSHTLNRFVAMSFLRLNGTLSQALILNNRKLKKEKTRQMRWMQLVASIVSFKISLFDPDILLLKMSKKLGFLWSRGAVGALAGLWAVLGYLMMMNSDVFTSQVQDVFNAQNLLLLWVVMILGKVIHEFGHGLACKHFGGEVHEMGAMFILFSPFLFCNATDSWMFTNKWQRIVVNFAGIYIELFLAAFAGVLWIFTEPGLIHQLAFNLFFVSSLITIFFNVNPLMKFDGYYALADWLEVPNLKDRSNNAIIQRLSTFFVGRGYFPPDPIVERFKWPILVYGVASYWWTIVIFFSMLNALGYILKPFGLEKLFSILASVSLSMGIIGPFFATYLMVTRTVKARGPGGGLAAFAVRRLLYGLAGLAVLLVLPLPAAITTSCLIDINSLVPAVTGVDGFLREVSVKSGDKVAKGTPLAKLENRNLTSELDDARLRREGTLLAFQQAESEGRTGEAVQFAADIKQYNALIGNYEESCGQLVVKAPAAGFVSGQISTRDIGKLMKSGDILCQIAPVSGPNIEIYVPQDDVARVHPGQSVAFRLKGNPWRSFHGTVEDVFVSEASGLPSLAISKSSGGDIATVVNTTTGQIESAQPLYVVRVLLDDRDNLLRAGMTGRARIATGWEPFGTVLYRTFTRTFKLNAFD